MSDPAPSRLSDDLSADAACRAALVELMQIGMELARLVRDGAVAPAAGPAAVVEATAAFERVSRAVRRTVRMVRWLDEPVTARREGDRVAARTQILRGVEDRIDRVAEAGEAESLHAEMIERLDTVELEGEIAGRPVAEIIGEICRDLGLERWPHASPSLRRRPADVAALHARAAAAVGMTRAVDAPLPALARWERRPMPGDEAALIRMDDATLDGLDGRWRCRDG